VAEESAKARERQREQYNKRAKEFNYKVGDRVLLDIRVVKTGDSRKFTSKYRGPFRIIKVFSNETVDIADNTYVSQCVHVNRLKPHYETMLWQQEPRPPPFESTYDVGEWYRQSVQGQTAGKKAKESTSIGKNDKSDPYRMTTNPTGKRAATAAKKFQLTKQIAPYIWTRKKRRHDQ
jgi:hypothetical protein